MGAGILPTTIFNNQLYFLFGKENKYEDSAPGFSDFGGGTDNKENFLETACREASEELTGFLGSPKEIRSLLSAGTYTIDYQSPGGTHSTYRMHIFPFEYNQDLPFYYNNNQQFIQKHLDASVIKKTKIFEKEHIRWFSLNEAIKRRSEFRSYFQNILDIVYSKREKIKKFIATHKPKKLLSSGSSAKSRKNQKTRKNKK